MTPPELKFDGFSSVLTLLEIVFDVLDDKFFLVETVDFFGGSDFNALTPFAPDSVFFGVVFLEVELVGFVFGVVVFLVVELVTFGLELVVFFGTLVVFLTTGFLAVVVFFGVVVVFLGVLVVFFDAGFLVVVVFFSSAMNVTP